MIRLRPMGEAEFAAYREHALDDYSRPGRIGNWPSAEIAEREFHRQLPQGLATPDQHLLVIEDAVTAFSVGFLWMAVRQRDTGPEAFVFDLVILPAFRRRGFAEAAMLELEIYVRDLGVAQISLHVFEHNAAARALYDKLGFVPIGKRMGKKLP
jgi:ribosomal protein S18 acetylase RimI-like enzyme